MKKTDRTKTARVVALILAALMIVSALLSAILSMGLFHDHAHAETTGTSYEISACMLPEQQAVRCEQTTVFVNDTNGKLSQLFFSCYLNAFRRESTLPLDTDDLYGAFPSGYAPGSIEFASVRVNGQTASWGVRGEDETVLRVAVDLAPGESAVVEMAYDLLLPECSAFVGAGQFDWRLTNAFPTLCALDEDAFRTNGVLSAGRFAFAECADWRLELSLPEGWQAAASGAGEREEAQDGRIKWTFEALSARDMAVVIGRRYTQFVSENDGRICIWANDSAAAHAALETAERALTLYEEWFGPCPFAQIDLVMSQFVQDMRSAPGLLLLNKELFALAERAELEYMIALGLAQQFFGEAVGVDPYREPWLCESVSALCALLYYDGSYGEKRFLSELRTRVQPSLTLTIPGGAAADSSAAYFNTRTEYELMLRGRGTAALYELMLAMGREELLAAMRSYYSQNSFAEGTIESFVSACDAATGREWGRFLTEMLASIGTDTNQTEWY